MTAYYNEIEPFAVAWLRELIREGVIADGIVDDRSIEVVEPKDLNGFTQCHFFAGVGVWSYALRRAGWPDDRPVWTGSCPCQPFSAAGKEEGFADPRHLWPNWFRLAREHRPITIFGEQVERAIRSHWLDLVSTDLEAEGYAVGSAVFGSHSVGAPNRRQRLYFVADAEGRNGKISVSGRRPDEGRFESGRRSGFGGMADASSGGIRAARPERPSRAPGKTQRGKEQRQRLWDDVRECGPDGGLAQSEGEQHERREREREEGHGGNVDDRNEPRRVGAFAVRSTSATGILGGFWSEAEWVECTDGKARPIKPGAFPLVASIARSLGPIGDKGFPLHREAPWNEGEYQTLSEEYVDNTAEGRVGRLRGYGNAINAEAAVAFIEAYREVKGEL